MMRTCACYYGHYVDKKFAQNENTACWLGVNKWLGEVIYIRNFSFPKTKKYQKLLISLINEITPCSKVKGKIKFKTFKHYDKSLVLLNFIRNLWHEPICGYTQKFFTALEKSGEKYKDPMQRLTWANKKACFTFSYGSAGHSNVCAYDKLIIRSKKEFTEANMLGTYHFLTGYAYYMY